MELRTEIIIEKNAALVWQNLISFSKYEQWNPYIKSIYGNLREGEVLKVQFPTTIMNVKVEAVEKNEILIWSASFKPKWLMKSKHEFYIIPINENSCKFYQSETFKGLLVWLMGGKIRKSAKKDFDAMNQALKTLVENSN